MSPTRDERDLVYRGITLLVGVVFRSCFRLRYAGASRVPAGRSIVAGNHVSALDGVVLGLCLSERHKRVTRFLVAAEFFHHHWFGWALRRFKQIPVRRGTRDRTALEAAIVTVRAGALAGIFPEGKVNAGSELQPGKSGVARIALATGAPIVPVGIWGTQDRWPQPGLHWRRPWRPRLALAFGEPIQPAGEADSEDDVERLVDQVMGGIADQVEVARAMTASR